jgi:DNA protecting protein DprA
VVLSIDPITWPFRSLRGVQLGLPGPSLAALDLVGPLIAGPRLAIVGSRAAHRHVLQALGPIVEVAGQRGWSLVSGGALGVDGGAHRAALERGIPQLAVLPCGRDRIYPPNHASMFAALINSGCAGLLFAHPPDTPTVREIFASRNAIVVGLADALLVAEASLRSGSRGTGQLGLQQGLPVAALSGSAGCGALIGEGARALGEAPRDGDPDQLRALAGAVGAWLDELGGAEPSPESAAPSWPPRLVWLAHALADAGPAGASIDAMPDPIKAAVALCEAELLGLVCEAAAGRWIAIGKRPP